MKRKTPLLIAVGILFFFTSLLTIVSLKKIILSTAPDFNVLWLASKDLRLEKNPYINPEIFTGIGYPTNTLFFYMPFTLINYQLAQGIFLLLSLGTTVYSVFLSFKVVLSKIPAKYFLFALALTLLSFPTKFTLGMGQNNAIALLILLFSFLLFKKDKPIPAGILLGVAISLKTLFVFFLIYYFLQKRWKLLLYTFITIGTLTIVTALIWHYGWYDYYLTRVIPPLLNLSGREIYYNQGIMGFISRIFTDLALRKNLSTLLSLFLIVAAGYFTLKKKNKNLTFSLFIITLPLIDTLSWQHHFVWLIFPFIVVSYYLAKLKRYGLLILLGISYLLVSWNFKDPNIYSNYPLKLLLSNQFFGTILLWELNFYLLTTNRNFE